MQSSPMLSLSGKEEPRRGSAEGQRLVFGGRQVDTVIAGSTGNFG